MNQLTSRKSWAFCQNVENRLQRETFSSTAATGLLWIDGSGNQVTPACWMPFRQSDCWLIGGQRSGYLSHIVFTVVDVNSVWSTLMTHPLQAGALLGGASRCWPYRPRWGWALPVGTLQPALSPTSLPIRNKSVIQLMLFPAAEHNCLLVLFSCQRVSGGALFMCEPIKRTSLWKLELSREHKLKFKPSYILNEFSLKPLLLI